MQARAYVYLADDANPTVQPLLALKVLVLNRVSLTKIVRTGSCLTIRTGVCITCHLQGASQREQLISDFILLYKTTDWYWYYFTLEDSQMGHFTP